MGWKKTKAPFTRAFLLSQLRYDPRTGKWWRLTGRRRGQEAGYRMPAGYLRIKIGGRGTRYLGHVLAWFYMTGVWPRHIVDHENNNKSDLRWCNLRAATWVQNRVNSKCRSDNRSGYKGVYKSGSKWGAVICFNKERRLLGRFTTPKLAHNAYLKAANDLHGAFARGR